MGISTWVGRRYLKLHYFELSDLKLEFAFWSKITSPLMHFNFWSNPAWTKYFVSFIHCFFVWVRFGFGKGWDRSLEAGRMALHLHSYFWKNVPFCAVLVRHCMLPMAPGSLGLSMWSGLCQSASLWGLWILSYQKREIWKKKEQRNMNGYNSLTVWQRWS